MIALIIVTVVIERWKDNKLQEWLARSHVGRAPDKYDSVELERAELKLAFE